MPFWYNKIDSLKWIDGSIRVDLTTAERGVWADLLAMAGLTRDERRGFIERSKGIPYPQSVILSRLNLVDDEAVYDSTIRKCVIEGRLKKHPDGTLEIVNWKKYNDLTSFKERKQRKRVAIERTKGTKRRQETATDRLLAVASDLQAILTDSHRKLSELSDYKLQEDGTFIDKKSGEVLSKTEVMAEMTAEIEDLNKAQKRREV